MTDETLSLEQTEDDSPMHAYAHRRKSYVPPAENPLYTFDARLAAARCQLPDIDEVITPSTLRVPNCVMEFILGSDVGFYVAYYLAKSPDYARRLCLLPRDRALAEIRKYAAVWRGVYGYDVEPRPLSERRREMLSEWMPCTDDGVH